MLWLWYEFSFPFVCSWVESRAAPWLSWRDYCLRLLVWVVICLAKLRKELAKRTLAAVVDLLRLFGKESWRWWRWLLCYLQLFFWSTNLGQHILTPRSRQSTHEWWFYNHLFNSLAMSLFIPPLALPSLSLQMPPVAPIAAKWKSKVVKKYK